VDNVSDTDSVASSVFAEASYTLADLPLELTVGVRRFRDRLESQDFNAGVGTAPAAFTFTSTNPRFSASWRPSSELQLYTSASKGFRSGQVQPSIAVALAALVGLDLPAYELGAKAILLDKRMTAEAAVYRSDWKDVTVRIPIGTTGFNGLINSNGIKSEGIEANVAYDLTRAWSMSLGGSHTRSRYAGDVPGTGITKGSKVDNVPATTLSGSTEYRFAAIGAWQGTARLGIQHTSAREAPSFPQNRAADSITNVNARLSFENEGWTVSLYGENLSDERGAVSARTVQPLGPGVDDVFANRLRPRTIGLEVRYAFGR
jgi:iron complex outermembrane recepter protein